jgi:hypothetical protein
MAINFPASPSLNQTYTYEGRTWKWNGVGWQIYVANPSPEVGLNSVSTTLTVAPNATASSTITLHPMVLIHSITCSAPAWIRVYNSDAASTADSERPVTVDPTPGAGVVTEILADQTPTTTRLTPLASAVNQESPRNSVFPVRVTNLSASASTIDLTFEYAYLMV